MATFSCALFNKAGTTHSFAVRIFCVTLALFLFVWIRPAFADVSFYAFQPGVTYHAIGNKVAFRYWGAQSSDGAGFLTYGPYTSTLRNGAFKASFSLRIDNNDTDDQVVAYVDVHDSVSGKVLVRREIYRKEFVSAGSTQTFDLSFRTDTAHKLEFRVYAFGVADLVHLKTSIAGASFSMLTAVHLNIRRRVREDEGDLARSQVREPDYNSYVLFTKDLRKGTATATFSLLIDENRSDNEIVGRLAIYDTIKAMVIARRIIRRQDFLAPRIKQEFDVVFEAPTPLALEYRVEVMGGARFELNSAVVRPDQLDLTSLWKATAHFEYRRRWMNSSDSSTSSLIANDGSWYTFNRAVAAGLPDSQLALCRKNGRDPVKVVARSSSDHGTTWSDPVEVAVPGTDLESPDYCSVVDGGAYFDGETDTWHYLGQCYDTSSRWNLCHYSRGVALLLDLSHPTQQIRL